MRKIKGDRATYKERRKKLTPLIEGSALILVSNPEVVRNNDVFYPYRQDSNLYYLTGFEEPGSIFIYRPGSKPESVLFVRKKNPIRETWDGFRFGVEKAKEEFGMDATYSIDDFETEAPKLLKDMDNVYYTLFQDHNFDLRLQSVIECVKEKWGRSGRGNLAIKDSYPLLGELRVHKSEQEANELRKACEISSEAHVEIMKATKPGVNERALYGLFISEIMKRGADRLGYESIIAGGNNATTLHYVFNDQNLKDGELLLVDAGAENNYYTGDITRSYPINGKFSPVQKRLYQRVLDIQKQVVQMVKPGITLKDIQDKAVSGLVDLMLEEKLLKGSKEKIIESKDYKKFYPHNIGHWLGSDVHDSGAYEVNKEPRKFEPGMCLTIEPGLYIPQDTAGIAEELKGIGIRIEDNILVTDLGYENMTQKAPKEIDELEAIIGT